MEHRLQDAAHGTQASWGHTDSAGSFRLSLRAVSRRCECVCLFAIICGVHVCVHMSECVYVLGMCVQVWESELLLS